MKSKIRNCGTVLQNEIVVRIETNVNINDIPLIAPKDLTCLIRSLQTLEAPTSSPTKVDSLAILTDRP